MKNKLFGQRITPSCAYCSYAVLEKDACYCSKSKRIKNNKCRSFNYNPLMRVPKSTSFKSNYSIDDFKF